MFVRSHLFLVFLLVAYSTATSVWVDSATGDDTAAGTQTAPFLTLKKALASIRTTDAYTGQSSTINLVSNNYTVGTSTGYLYVTTDGLDLTITSTVRSTLITAGNFFGVYVGGNGTVTFDNISIYPNLGTSSSRVLYVWQSSITLNNCYFADFQVQIGPALYFDGGEANVTIKNCVFERITPGIQSSAVVYIAGITNTSWNAVIQDTTVRRIDNTAYAFYFANTNVTIRDSTIEDNSNKQLIYCAHSDIESHNTKINSTSNPILECYDCVVHTDTSYGVAASGCSIIYNPTTTAGSSGSTANSSTTDSSTASRLCTGIAVVAIIFAMLI